MSNLGSFIGGFANGYAEEERQRKRRTAAPSITAPLPAADPNGVTFNFATQVQPRGVEPPSISVPDAGATAGVVGGE